MSFRCSLSAAVLANCMSFLLVTLQIYLRNDICWNLLHTRIDWAYLDIGRQDTRKKTKIKRPVPLKGLKKSIAHLIFKGSVISFIRSSDTEGRRPVAVKLVDLLGKCLSTFLGSVVWVKYPFQSCQVLTTGHTFVEFAPAIPFLYS